MSSYGLKKLGLSKNHLFYDEEIIKNISKLLGISNQLDIEELNRILENSAISLSLRLRDIEKELSISKRNSLYKKISNHQKKSAELYRKSYNGNISNIIPVLKNIRLEKNIYEDELSLIMNLISSKKSKINKIDLSKLESLFFALSYIFEKSQDKPNSKRTNRTIIIARWINSISDFWEEKSKIKISEGKYGDKGFLYKSKAIDILNLMISPINKILDKSQKINKSILYQAIRLRRDMISDLPILDLSDVDDLD